LSGSVLDALLGPVEEFLASLLAVDGLAGWGSAVFTLLPLLFLLPLLVFLGLVEGSGQDDGFSRGAFSIEIKVDLGVFDGLFRGWVKESGNDVVALSGFVHGLEVNPFLFGFTLEANDDSGALFSPLLFEFVWLTDLDLLGLSVLRQGFEVEDVLFGGVWPSAVVEDVVFLVLAKGLNFGPEATVLDIEIDLGSEWKSELNLSVVSGNVTLVVEWSDEADLSLSTGRVDELNIRGNVDGLWDSERSLLLLFLGLYMYANLSVSRNQSRYVQRVNEWETSSRGQSNSDRVLVVHLLVVEGLSVLKKMSPFPELLGQKFDGVVIESVETFGSSPVDEHVSFQLLGDPAFEVEDLSDFFVGEFLVLLLLLLSLFLVPVAAVLEFIFKKIGKIVHAGNHGTGTNAVVFVSVDILSEVVEDGVWDQAVFASDVVNALGVSQVKSFDDVVGQVLVRVLGTKLLLGQHVDGGLSVLAEFIFGLILELSSGFDSRFDSRTNLVAGIFMSKFSHALEHACWWVGLHQVVDSSDTYLVGFSGVGVGLVKNRSGESWVDLGQFVQRNDDEGALEVGHFLFTFQVGFENAEDLRVGHVSKSPDVNLGLVAIFLLNGLAELLGHVWDVFFNDGLFVFGGKATKSVYRVTVVSGIPAYLSHADEVGESENSRGVKSGLVDDFGFLYQFKEFLHVFSGWGSSGFGEGSDDLSGFFSLDLTVLDPLLDDH